MDLSVAKQTLPASGEQVGNGDANVDVPLGVELTPWPG
jgi:hypothetical protein